MTSTLLPSPCDLRPGDDTAPAPDRPVLRSFEVVVEHLGDAARFARIVSAEVNPMPVALATATVDGTVVYPVASVAGLSGRVVRLRFRTRDRRTPLDTLLIDAVVERVAGHGVVLGVVRLV